MKKFFIYMLICLMFVGCRNNSDKTGIEGSWVEQYNQEKLFFDDNGNVVIDDETMARYSIYDENKIMIKTDGLINYTLNAEFYIEDETLILKDLNSYSERVYYSENKMEKKIKEEYGSGYSGKEFLGPEISDAEYDEIQKRFDKYVYPYYVECMDTTKAHRTEYYNNVTINGKDFFVLKFYWVESGALIDYFAISPNENEIYWYDYMKIADGKWHLWIGEIYHDLA